MKIFTKLLLCIVATGAFMATVGFVSVFYLTSMSGPLEKELPARIQDLDSASHLDGLSQQIRYYDELLTQSARNYAFTQDEKWKERYAAAEPELDLLIKEAMTKGDVQDQEIFGRIDQANMALVNMEHRAMDLVDGGAPEDAIRILESEQYRAEKAIYAEGLSEYISARGFAYDETLRVSVDMVNSVAQDAKKSVVEYTWFLTIAIPLAICGLATAGFIVVRSVIRPLYRLQKASGEMANGNYDAPVDSSGADEVQTLVGTFADMRNAMKARTLHLEASVQQLLHSGKELEQSYHRLKELDKKKDEFVNIAAHELRSPLLPIILSAEGLSEEGCLNEPDRENVEIIMRNANRLNKLITNILDTSRIENHTLKLHYEETDVEALAQYVINDAIHLQAHHSGDDDRVEIVLDSRLAAARKMRLDKARIVQVLANLVDNALNFTERGAITMEIDEMVVDGLPFVEFRISDSGAGIDEEVRNKLFQKFATKSDKGKGTGLGLYLSKMIVEAHGGKIWGKNNESGRGATFAFTLPVLPRQN
jgi:signal transduction histidine kinase